MAGALVGEPKILILDEPTVGLDPKQITEIRSLIKDLGKTHTVILSSHILSEVSKLCERVVCIFSCLTKYIRTKLLFLPSLVEINRTD